MPRYLYPLPRERQREREREKRQFSLCGARERQRQQKEVGMKSEWGRKWWQRWQWILIKWKTKNAIKANCITANDFGWQSFFICTGFQPSRLPGDRGGFPASTYGFNRNCRSVTRAYINTHKQVQVVCVIIYFVSARYGISITVSKFVKIFWTRMRPHILKYSEYWRYKQW